MYAFTKLFIHLTAAGQQIWKQLQLITITMPQQVLILVNEANSNEQLKKAQWTQHHYLVNAKISVRSAHYISVWKS